MRIMASSTHHSYMMHNLQNLYGSFFVELLCNTVINEKFARKWDSKLMSSANAAKFYPIPNSKSLFYTKSPILET